MTEGSPLPFHRRTAGYVATFAALPPWQRVAIPAVGGALAGLTLFLGARLYRQKSSTDYMEAIVLGSGQRPRGRVS